MLKVPDISITDGQSLVDKVVQKTLVESIYNSYKSFGSIKSDRDRKDRVLFRERTLRIFQKIQKKVPEVLIGWVGTVAALEVLIIMVKLMTNLN